MQSVTNLFDYNPRSELTSALMNTNDYQYKYDPIGNREKASLNAATNFYAANELNQYTNIANGVTNQPTYDADGNMLTCGDWTFTWNGENRLIVASNTTTIIESSYDYMGRRFRKVVNGVTNTYLYDGWAMIREASPTVTNSYVYGLDLSGSAQSAGTIGGILSAVLNGTNIFYCYDANGNVTDLVDTNGSSVAHYEYGPFGQKTTESGTLSASNPFQLSSKYLDAETELYYYGYRFYRPKLGRWINRDPLGDKSFLLRRGQGKSRKERNKLWLQARRPLYMFVENNAINSVDYLGLMGGSGSWSQWCSCKAACGKDACTTAKDAKDGAENDAISITGETGVCWNNSCDAVRHCIWSCEQAKKDTTAAACVTKWHEDWGDANGQTANERTMDDHNNGIGARLASGTAGCKSACKKAWEDNKLITVAP